MKSRNDTVQIAVRAMRCLKDYALDSIPVDPFQLAAAVGIEVRPKPDCERGVSGILIRHGDNFGILYATHVKNQGFQRFSVAHELGHYFLDGHPEKVLNAQGVHQSHAGFSSPDRFEREADCFASNLLMPSTLVRPLVRRMDETIEGISKLAKRCLTSLVSTAIRVVELTELPLAVVVSRAGKVEYCHCSGEMMRLVGFPALSRGQSVPPSVTADLARGGSVSEVVSGTSSVAEWFGVQSETELVEESIVLGGYGKQLTLLVAKKCGDESEEDDGEDEEMKERWRPRF